MEYLIEYGQRLSDLGYSHVLLEVEDKFCFTRHPTINHPDAFGHEEYQVLKENYRNIGLEIIPLWQTLGHASAIVGKPEFAHLREQESVNDQYDPTSEEAQLLLTELLDELIDVLRPEEFIHLGGDETRNLAKSEKLQRLVSEIGKGEIYLRHMLPLLEHIRKRGLKPIIWADMILTYPEILKKLPKWVILIEWDYFSSCERVENIRVWGHGFYNIHTMKSLQEGKARKLVEKYAIDAQTRRDGLFRGFFYADALNDMGFKVIIASANRCFGDSVGTPNNKMHLPNAYFAGRKSKDLFGTCLASWAVRHNHPNTHWPANFIAAAGYKENNETYEERTLIESFTECFFGVRLPDFYDVIKKGCITWDYAQAYWFPARIEALKKGENPFAPDIKELGGEHNCSSLAHKKLMSVREGYIEALVAIVACIDSAKKNNHYLFYWREGIEYNLFHVDCILAFLVNDNTIATTLLQRLKQLKSNTEKLFRETYEPNGVEEELNLRYSFFEQLLSQSNPNDKKG
jgi:hypothetical protein